MFSSPTPQTDNTLTSAFTTKKISLPPPILKRGNNFCIKQVSTGRVQLAVVKLKVEANGRSLITYGLLDPGSELSLMTCNTLRTLKLYPPTEEMLMGTLHGDALIAVQKADITISSLDDSFSFIAYELPAIKTFNLHTGTIDWPKEKTNYPHLADLDLVPIDFSKITIFLGSDYQDALEELEVRKSTPDSPGPWGIKTVFGWCVRGPLLQTAGHNTSPCFNLIQTKKSRAELNELVHNLWSVESFGILPDVKLPIGKDNARALKLLDENVRCVEMRYEAPLLWSTDHPDLPDNYVIALSRFHNLDKSLKKNATKAAAYEHTIEDYISQNHARKLDENEFEGPVGRTWYLPHHAVFNPSKPKKCRVVFDGAASFRGVSLNNRLLTGPDLLTSLIGVLLRLRERKIAISGDIKGMFHQVRVRQVDTHALRLLWRSPTLSGPPDVYAMQVQIFGAASSPTVCSYVLRRAAADNESEFPGLVERVKNNCYMDNYMDSFDTEEEAMEFRHTLQEGLGNGGFLWTQWMSTSRVVLASIPKDLRSDPALDLNLDPLPC